MRLYNMHNCFNLIFIILSCYKVACKTFLLYIDFFFLVLVNIKKYMKLYVIIKVILFAYMNEKVEGLGFVAITKYDN